MFRLHHTSHPSPGRQVEADPDFGVRSLDSDMMSDWHRAAGNADNNDSERLAAASLLFGLPEAGQDNDSQGSSTPQSPHSRSGLIIAEDAAADGSDPPATSTVVMGSNLPSPIVAASYTIQDSTHPYFSSASPAPERGRSQFGTPSFSRGSSPSSSHSLPTSLLSASSISSLSRTVSPADSAFDSPAQPHLSHLNRSYVFSRTHWAVEEARRRTEEQGDDLSLVLPTLQLPADSLLLSDSTRLHEQSANNGVAAHRGRRPKPLRIILCGTNRTVNAFLRSLAADQRVKVYKLKGTGRSRDGIYDVGVIAAEDEDSSGTASTKGADSEPHRSEETTASQRQEAEQSSLAASPAVSAKDNAVSLASARSSDVSLLARIHVVGRGQDGNMQRVIKRLECQHKRLNSLLNPFASTHRDDQAKADMEQLIRMWSSKPPSSEGSEPHESAHWYDVAVLTGDSRYLAGRDRDLISQLTRMIPTICYPDTLAKRLTPYVEMPFFSLLSSPPSSVVIPQPTLSAASTDLAVAVSSQEGPTPRCAPFGPQGQSYFPPQNVTPILATDAMDDLVEYLLHSHRKQTISRERRESARIHAFLDWKATQDDIALDSSLESSGTAPLPTLARAGANADWESNLSRRHAARAERKTSYSAPKGPLAMGLQHQSSAPANFFSDGAWRSKAVVSSEPQGSLLGKAVLGPLQRLRATVFPATRSSGWAWTAVACVTVAIGWGCWWKFRTIGL